MYNNIKQDFGHRLKFIIVKKFKTQTAFSKQFNINRVNLNNWITGRGQPDYETLVFLSQCLDESIDWLLSGKITTNSIASQINLELWDEVVDHCLNFATEHNFIPTGRFFIGIYQSFIEETKTNNNLSVMDIINKHKSIILSQKTFQTKPNN